MKLAEALLLRADLQKRLEQVKVRFRNNIKVQEGDEPNEEPGDLLLELKRIQEEQKNLIKKINKTNSETEFAPGISLADALVDREVLLVKRNILAGLVDAASESRDRYSMSEIRTITTIDVRDYQQQVDQLSRDYRELDTKIQSLNWNVDLL